MVFIINKIKWNNNFAGLLCILNNILLSKKLEFSKIIKFWIISSFSTAIAFILGTPSAWQKPRLWLTQAIETQFNIVVDSYVLTNGLFFSASNLPNDHLLNVFFYKLPLVFHLSLIITIYFSLKINLEKLWSIILFFYFLSIFNWSKYWILFIYTNILRWYQTISFLNSFLLHCLS
ncbi:hypothetical protein CM15mP35_02120 [bacterium]|nr:MAG: hypothetical protein CM15mP35_02120 [bacterium]